ncbi:MAG TPA: amidohydrolase family protein [Phycisphaerae bacterium]|nr:amidohydrolase family protein [Phycisphaerae bacterium]HNU43927.1 amidohydrolase family protein [Phycisphaerae bacterium]
MIVDCYTHVWDGDAQLGPHDWERARPPLPTACGYTPAGAARHRAAAEPARTTLVVGFKSRYLHVDIPNASIAAYVGAHPDRLIGFAGLDPTEPREALRDLRIAQEELKLSGLAVAPAAQDFHPTDSRAMRIYAEAAERKVPLFFHSGLAVLPQTKLEYARPMLLDEVARELPDLRIMVAHLGYPWVQETIALLAKHPHVFAELSWLLDNPWETYQALLSACQYGVIDKICFGSGFPCSTPAQALEQLFSIPHLVHGTNLPPVPREALRGIVERDVAAALGLPRPAGKPPAAAPSSASDDEDRETADGPDSLLNK